MRESIIMWPQNLKTLTFGAEVTPYFWKQEAHGNTESNWNW